MLYEGAVGDVAKGEIIIRCWRRCASYLVEATESLIIRIIMEEMYGLSDKAIMSPDNLIFPSDFDRIPLLGSDDLISAASVITQVELPPQFPPPQEDDDESSSSFSVIKARIASHPHYPRLLQAYIDCHKIGAPPEMACLFDEIRRLDDDVPVSTSFGDDPDLDHFMETYCHVLLKHKSDLARPFDEATSFLNNIQTQLADLCNTASALSLSDDGGVSSEEDFSGEGGEADLDGQAKGEDRELKDMLLRKFGDRIGSLKLGFSKKKKKGKLPKEARQALFDWWSLHYKWPYPTESDKKALAKSTGLDQKQINNWFINQRKRHWKPPENMSAQFSLFSHG